MSQHYTFKFYSPRSLLTPERITRLLQSFMSSGLLVTNYMAAGGAQAVRDAAGFDPRLAVAADGSCLVSLSAASAAGFTRLFFQAYPAEAKGAQAYVAIDEDVFEADPAAASAWLLEAAKIVNLHLPVRFGWGDHEMRLDRMEEALRFDRVGALAWANLFGPDMVQQIGLDRLEALPAHQVQVFKQGVLCLLTPLPGQSLPPRQVERIREQWPGCVLPAD